MWKGNLYKVLAIGDTANVLSILKKNVKTSKIEQIQFRTKNFQETISYENQYFFKSDKIFEQVEEINQIKRNYDLFMVTGWTTARLAYLAGLKFIWIYTGDDIKHPFFLKDKIHDYNFLERIFYKKVFKSVARHVSLIEAVIPEDLKRFTDSDIILGGMVDISKFNPHVKPIELRKQKFTFLSPQRISPLKGTDVIWKAISLCKNNFEVLQPEWYDDYNTEIERKSKELLKIKPPNVKLIPLIKYGDIAKYYAYADCILGQLSAGWPGSVEREAAYCNRPVITYTNPKYKVNINGKMVSPPFLPTSKDDPYELSKIIDMMVSSKEFRERMQRKGHEFVKNTSNPEIIANRCEKIFQELDEYPPYLESKLTLFLRRLFFVISYYSNFKRIFQKLINRKR